MAKGERLYFYLIQSSGEFDKFEQYLNDILGALRLLSSACAYLIFGNYDFIVRIWADQTACYEFELRLNELHQKKELRRWKKLFVSTMNTWVQREIERRQNLPALTFDVLQELWQGTPPEALSFDPTTITSKETHLIRFFMFIEEPFDVEQKALRFLGDILNNPDPHADGLVTWSLYSY